MNRSLMGRIGTKEVYNFVENSKLNSFKRTNEHNLICETLSIPIQTDITTDSECLIVVEKIIAKMFTFEYFQKHQHAQRVTFARKLLSSHHWIVKKADPLN
jgi:hypothetical protein